MTIDLHINAETADELRTKVKDLFNLRDDHETYAPGTAGYGPVAASIDEAPEVVPVADMPDQSGAAKPKKTRAKKAPEQEVLPPEPAATQEKRAQASTPTAGDEPPPGFLADTPSVDACKDALKPVLSLKGETGGINGALAVLGTFTSADGSACTKVTHIKDEDRAAFIVACKSVVG